MSLEDNVVYENASYKVVLSPNVHIQDEPQARMGYSMISKQHSVIEYEDYLLPVVIEMADTMDRSLRDKLRGEPKDKATVVKLN